MGKFNERKYELFKFIYENGGTVRYDVFKERFPTKFRSIYVYRRYNYLKIHKIGNSKNRYITLYEKGNRAFKKMDFLNKKGLSLNIRKEFLPVR